MIFDFEFNLDELKLLKHEVEIRIKKIEESFRWTNSIHAVDGLEASLLKAKKTLNKIENMIQIILLAEEQDAHRSDGN